MILDWIAGWAGLNAGQVVASGFGEFTRDWREFWGRYGWGLSERGFGAMEGMSGDLQAMGWGWFMEFWGREGRVGGWIGGLWGCAAGRGWMAVARGGKGRGLYSIFCRLLYCQRR